MQLQGGAGKAQKKDPRGPDFGNVQLRAEVFFGARKSPGSTLGRHLQAVEGDLLAVLVQHHHVVAVALNT